MDSPSARVNEPRTILGPLTTRFTAPVSCDYINVPRTSWSGKRGWRGQACKSTSAYGMLDATQCWPPTTAGAAFPSTPFSGWGFYSPGLACPHGYTSACTATANGDAQWPVQYTMLDGETAVGCCPSGYTCFNLGAGASCSLIPTSTTIVMASCDSQDTMNLFTQTFPYITVLTTTAEESTTTTITTMIESVIALAPIIQINWRSTDLSTTPTSVSSSTTVPSNATTPDNENASGAMSTGAIIGVVAGCVVTMAAIWVSWLFIRRKRRRALHVDNMSQDQGQSKNSADLLQLSQDDRRPIELGDNRNPPELPGIRLVAELDASDSGGASSSN